MVVLDADSLMAGETLTRLALMMDEAPNTGLIQTAPGLVGRMSVFGRLQQFATRLYGPMLSDGLAHTSGAASNYWGHNAIIRTAAFASCAGLPKLPGPKPFGGEIMSHDFVEAALLRRGGWDTCMAPQLTGSYEECPPTLPDMILRERRWCQGNLQHLPIIAARGLHWMSRIHLIQGVLTYLMPPVWLLFLLVGAGVSAEAHVYAQAWDDYSLDTLNWVVAISVLSLMAPRMLALIRALGRTQERRLWGDPWKLIAGVLLETVLSALIAPIMMIAQTRSLIEILMGRDLRVGGAAAGRRLPVLAGRQAPLSRTHRGGRRARRSGLDHFPRRFRVVEPGDPRFAFGHPAVRADFGSPPRQTAAADGPAGDPRRARPTGHSQGRRQT